MIVFESTAIAYSRYDTSQLLHISIIWDVDLWYMFLSAVVHTEQGLVAPMLTPHQD